MLNNNKQHSRLEKTHKNSKTNHSSWYMFILKSSIFITTVTIIITSTNEDYVTMALVLSVFV